MAGSSGKEGGGLAPIRPALPSRRVHGYGKAFRGIDPSACPETGGEDDKRKKGEGNCAFSGAWRVHGPALPDPERDSVRLAGVSLYGR